MATTKVIDVIQRAQTILQDTTGTRWPEQELLNWFNDAQLAVVNRRPDANTKNTEFTAVLGTRQTLPADGLRLMKITRNLPGMAVRSIPVNVLNDQLPNWHDDSAPADQVDHYVYDERDPKIFYLFPAPAAGVKVEMVYSTAPSAITIADFATDNQTLTLDDSYLNPILDFMLYRAYSKDADYAANGERATAHLQAFSMAMGDKAQSDSAMAGG